MYNNICPIFMHMYVCMTFVHVYICICIRKYVCMLDGELVVQTRNFVNDPNLHQCKFSIKHVSCICGIMIVSTHTSPHMGHHHHHA